MTALDCIVGQTMTNLDLTPKRLVLYSEVGAAITVSVKGDEDAELTVDVSE